MHIKAFSITSFVSFQTNKHWFIVTFVKEQIIISWKPKSRQEKKDTLTTNWIILEYTAYIIIIMSSIALIMAKKVTFSNETSEIEETHTARIKHLMRAQECGKKMGDVDSYAIKV